MSSYAHDHPEQFEPGGAGFEPLLDQADALRKEQKESPSYCVACGDPCPSGQRWCSTSCYRSENLDDRMEG